MRPHVRSCDATASYLLGRLRWEYSADPYSPAAVLLREVAPMAPSHFVPPAIPLPLPPTAPLELEIDGTIAPPVQYAHHIRDAARRVSQIAAAPIAPAGTATELTSVRLPSA